MADYAALASGLGVPFVDLSPYSLDEKERLTTEAMERREPLILGCRISADDLLGDPDLLRLEGDGYAPELAPLDRIDQISMVKGADEALALQRGFL